MNFDVRYIVDGQKLDGLMNLNGEYLTIDYEKKMKKIFFVDIIYLSFDKDILSIVEIDFKETKISCKKVVYEEIVKHLKRLNVDYSKEHYEKILKHKNPKPSKFLLFILIAIILVGGFFLYRSNSNKEYNNDTSTSEKSSGDTTENNNDVKPYGIVDVDIYKVLKSKKIWRTVVKNETTKKNPSLGIYTDTKETVTDYYIFNASTNDGVYYRHYHNCYNNYCGDSCNKVDFKFSIYLDESLPQFKMDYKAKSGNGGTITTFRYWDPGMIYMFNHYFGEYPVDAFNEYVAPYLKNCREG